MYYKVKVQTPFDMPHSFSTSKEISSTQTGQAHFSSSLLILHWSFLHSHICTIWYSALRHTSLAFKSMYLKDTGLTEIILLEFHAVCLVPSPHSCALLINADGIPRIRLMEMLSHLHVNVCPGSQNKWLMGARWVLNLQQMTKENSRLPTEHNY